MTPRILSVISRRKTTPARPPRVLIVDDDESMRLFVQHVLADAGCETTLAADGEEALAKASASPAFDLLVTDEMMPRMLGHQLARFVRQREPGMKVLYLTGFSDRLFAEKQSLWADEAFLDKPCTPKALIEAASRLLSGERLHDEHTPPRPPRV